MAEIALNESKLGDVKGKVAIVTGGASGIGKSLVELLHSRGATVVFCDVNPGEQIAKDLGSNAEFMKCDVLVWRELRGVFSHAKKKYGHIDVVFANAGIAGPLDQFEDKLDEDGELEEPNLVTIDVNLKSVVATSKLALFYFKSNSSPGGSLVLTASTAGYNGRPNIILYSAAKHGVVGLLRALSQFVTPDSGVTINAIAPGPTATAMFNEQAVAAAKKLGVSVQGPDYVALAGVFLASNRDWNGKTLTLIGSTATEVEGALKETQPLWYGKANTDMVTTATNINYKQIFAESEGKE